jgi:hypothetical protein
MPTIPTTPVNRYLQAPPLTFPIRHSTLDLLVERLTGYCKKCGCETHTLRGRVIEYPTCLDIEAGGVCPVCRVVTFFHLRWYPWGAIHDGDRGWVHCQEVTPWVSRPYDALRRVAEWLSRRWRNATQDK